MFIGRILLLLMTEFEMSVDLIHRVDKHIKFVRHYQPS